MSPYAPVMSTRCTWVVSVTGNPSNPIFLQDNFMQCCVICSMRRIASSELGGMLTVGQVLQKRYQVTAVLGQGDTSEVYQAYDQRLGIPCVVREFTLRSGTERQPNSMVLAFWQSAGMLSRLSHPNLPRVTDYFEEGGTYCLVMDLVEATSLNKLIGTSGIPESEVLNYAVEVLDALDYMHGQGVLHRNIKPSTIIVEPGGRAMLVGYGITTETSPSPHKARVFRHRTQSDAGA